ncbi:MAG: glucosidase, partial [Cytophagaceae bacterium]
MTAEHQRLAEADANEKPWRRFGPYLAERQWGTVREDYSASGDAWHYTTHDQARSRAYRWGEEGLGGFCDDRQLLCFGLALWNGQDAILKDQLFGLSGPQGNHGEDVKEVYYFLDNTPTHSYQKLLYKYPQRAFPYEQLVQENARRTRHDPEFELLDTGVFADDRYFDVFIEYAKAGPEDLLIQITAVNRGPAEAPLHVLPQLWFRNTWAWGYGDQRPVLAATADGAVRVSHEGLSELTWYADAGPALLFCDNSSNTQRLYGTPSTEQFFKDGINNYLVNKQNDAVSPACTGTKAAAHYALTLAAGATQQVRLRLGPAGLAAPFADFAQIMQQRQTEADEFYAAIQYEVSSADARHVQRQAFAGMLWNKQYYNYNVPRWLVGDPTEPAPPPERLAGRNADWKSFDGNDIISMPDTWEYPWFAAWDLAFHAIPLAQVDPAFAKNQLQLLTRDWYMHPNGQLPAYEWRFGDVNPPVHAWATFRIFKMEQKHTGSAGDVAFLQTMFHRLLLNFTWWVNRKDRDGRNIFEGGFLGLDNIGVFDRSAPLPFGGYLEQADGTAWVAMFALNMMRIALELSRSNPVYQDLASKFFEHFLYIAEAMTNVGNTALDLWDDEDEFYYDALNTPEAENKLLELIPY